MREEPIKVVCIEDEPDMIGLYQVVLSRRGFDFIGANSGKEGLEAVFHHKPDLILLDLMMPDMDGWEVFQQLKADESTRNIPVIVVTAKAQNIDKVLGLHIAKADDYLSKPFSPRTLLQSIANVLSNRKEVEG